jgi:hypothetical protein
MKESETIAKRIFATERVKGRRTRLRNFHTPPPVGQGLQIFEASRSHSDTPRSVGFLQTSDQPVAETST